MRDGSKPRILLVDDEPVILSIVEINLRLDGFEVCRRLRAIPGLADLRVIMLTAQAQDEDRRRGYALGVHEYVTKPFDPPALVELVRGAVAS